MPKTWIDSGVFEEFANDCHDENGRFCEGGSAGAGSSGSVAPVLSVKERANRDQIRREIVDGRAEDGKKPLSEASLNVYVIKEAGRRAAQEKAAGSGMGSGSSTVYKPALNEKRSDRSAGASVDEFTANKERLASAVKSIGGNLALFGSALTIKDNSWDANSGRDFRPRIEQHLVDLADIPAPLIGKFVGAGGKVVVGNGSITDLALPNLAGIRPRGWPEGTTYSNVPGVFEPRISTVVLGNIDGRGAGSNPVSHFALHEFTHGLDSLTTKIALESGKDDFKALHVAFVNGARGHMNDYYIQAGNPQAGLSETFADVGRGWLRGLAKGGDKEERGAVLRNTFAEAGTFVSAAVSSKMIGYMDKKFGAGTTGRNRKVA